jgi:hypothetical protein
VCRLHAYETAEQQRGNDDTGHQTRR